MRLLLILVFLSSFTLAQTDCISGNSGLITVYDSRGSVSTTHTQDYKANTAAILVSQKEGRSIIKTPDIVCTTKLSSSSSSVSSRFSSSSSVRSQAASSASSSQLTGLVAQDNFDGSRNGIIWPGGVFAGIAPSPSGGNALRLQYIAGSVHS